mmetsp:Transcript_19206/g.49189  ORF Transcript_19206/g.49189 Transcript_19206/m.49189 type:complete len:219 (-) Transcript_19206:228-884(-)
MCVRLSRDNVELTPSPSPSPSPSCPFVCACPSFPTVKVSTCSACSFFLVRVALMLLFSPPILIVTVTTPSSLFGWNSSSTCTLLPSTTASTAVHAFAAGFKSTKVEAFSITTAGEKRSCTLLITAPSPPPSSPSFSPSPLLPVFLTFTVTPPSTPSTSSVNSTRRAFGGEGRRSPCDGQVKEVDKGADLLSSQRWYIQLEESSGSVKNAFEMRLNSSS